MHPLTLCRYLLLGTGLAATSTVLAQREHPAVNAPTPATGSRQAPGAVAADLPRPADRNCLRTTGSLIPAKPGHCLAVPGRSYSQQDLRRTGQLDSGRALQQLDPSISFGH